jgi:hypothetical protein
MLILGKDRNLLFVRFNCRLSEVSPDWLRYELPKLGIAGSNPALRRHSCMSLFIIEGICQHITSLMKKSLYKKTACSQLIGTNIELTAVIEILYTHICVPNKKSILAYT